MRVSRMGRPMTCLGLMLGLSLSSSALAQATGAAPARIEPPAAYEVAASGSDFVIRSVPPVPATLDRRPKISLGSNIRIEAALLNHNVEAGGDRHDVR